MRFPCSTFTMMLGLSVLSAWAVEYKVPHETVLYYPFDTTATALESFGTAKAALAQGRGNVAFSSKGHAGGCLYFDGEATLTLEKMPEGMPLGRSPYTVSVWVRADRTKEFVRTGGWLGYGVRGENGAGNSFRHNGEDGVQNYWNWRDLNVRTPALADGAWHHVAGTWDGETRRLYYDGRLAGSDRQTPNVKWGPLVIGATINDRPYTGWIDDVLVARRAFSDEEIAALHRAGITGTDVAADGSSDGRLLAGDAFVTRAELDKARSREMAVTAKWLMLPVKNGARMCKVRVLVGEKTFREFDIGLAPGEPDWYAALDVSSLKGGRLTLRVDSSSAGSKTLDRVHFSDEAPVPDGYDGASRPQFHFSPARGWMNDPNGLSYYNGEWHLFFQHNPYGVNWGNMHWGHAVSKDLFHWREVGEALYPCELGAMFSGSAVVDRNNTAGFGRNAHVLTFTGTAAGSTQGIAYSLDGLNYKKWTGNPAVPNITGGNRDPRVFWYKPGRHWVLALYVAEKGRHNVVIFNSPDLKSWRRVGTIPGDRSGEGRFLYECPELFELRVEGENISRWVVFGASGEYSIGAFDGKTFTPECDRLILNRPIRGCGYYAAQTFGDVPDGRRILLAWFRTHMPGMAFNQSMGLPLELKLVRTSNGLRLAEFPVKEVESLRMGHAVPFSEFDGELVEAFIDMRVRPTGTVRLSLRGIPLAYDAAQETLEVDGVHTAWPLAMGRFKARLFIDRTGLEVFSLDGLVGLPVNNARATSSERRLRIVDGAQHVLEDESRAFKLKSVWRAGR